jgi:hypothetical protein
MEGEGMTSERFAHQLNRVGMGKLAAFLLDAAGPLTLFGAQALFMMEPLFGGFNNPIGDLARVLEDPEQVSELVECLREGGGK